MLILTSAVRSRWAVGDSSSPVAQLALALATALTAFFLLYVSEFTSVAPTVPFQRLPEANPRHTIAELPATAGLGGLLITTAVVVVPLLLTWQRGRAPAGLVTLLVVAAAWLSAAVIDLTGPAVLGALGASIGAVLADALVQCLDARLSVLGSRLPLLAT